MEKIGGLEDLVHALAHIARLEVDILGRARCAVRNIASTCLFVPVWSR